MAGEDSRFLVSTIPTPTVIKTDPNGATSPIVEMQPDKAERGKALRQVIAAVIANLGTINTGLVFGFSAVVIPQLKAKDSIIPIDDVQESWVASLSSAGTPFGCLLSGYVMDRLGRKKTLIMIEIPLIIGWLMIAFASNLGMIYAGRILVGFGSGLVGAPCRVYTSEVTQPHLRGMLGAFAAVGISLGVLFQYTVGSFVTWQVLSGVSAIIPMVALICMIFMPESPNYLVAKSKPEEAVKCLAKLRGSTYNVQREVDQMQIAVNKTRANSNKPSAKDTISALLSPATLKPFLILTVYFGMYQFTGVNAVTFYAVEIFQKTGTTMNKTALTILLGVARLIFTIVACVAMRKYGRRTLTFVSTIGCGVTMVGLGIYLYYLHQWQTAEPKIEPMVTWFPVACIFLFIVTSTLGFLVVPWVMIGELYPLKVRGIVGGMTTMMAHIFVFLVVKTYPFMATALYQHGVFIMYGCISFLATVFLYVYLPETKGKTLQEIEDYFSGRITSLNTKKPKNFDTNLAVNKDQGLIVEKDKLLT